MATIDDIKITHNFVDADQIETFKTFLDTNRPNLSEDFVRCFFGLKLGKDNLFKEESLTNLSKLSSIKDLVLNTTVPSLINLFKSEYKDDATLYASSLWLIKHYYGSRLALHTDDDDGLNSQFKYGVIIYLNDSSDALEFPNLDFKYKPVAGDAIMFPSTGKEFQHEVPSIRSDRYTILMWVTEDESYNLLDLPSN